MLLLKGPSSISSRESVTNENFEASGTLDDDSAEGDAENIADISSLTVLKDIVGGANKPSETLTVVKASFDLRKVASPCDPQEFLNEQAQLQRIVDESKQRASVRRSGSSSSRWRHSRSQSAATPGQPPKQNARERLSVDLGSSSMDTSSITDQPSSAPAIVLNDGEEVISQPDINPLEDTEHSPDAEPTQTKAFGRLRGLFRSSRSPSPASIHREKES
jgi:hypothetical protein